MIRSFKRCLFPFVLFFIFAFPKAGFYFHGLPICFSMILIVITAGYFFLSNFFQKKLLRPIFPMMVALVCFAFLILALSYLSHYSVWKDYCVILVAAVVFPVSGLLIGGHIGREGISASVSHALLIALWVVVLFGLASFIATNVFGIVIGVPFLTETGGDLFGFIGKDNLRIFVVKACSTYNNGNLLGMGLLIWAPLVYYGLQRRAVVLRVATQILLCFTFSRTIWTGLIASEFFYHYREGIKVILKSLLGVIVFLLLINFIVHLHIFNYYSLEIVPTMPHFAFWVHMPPATGMAAGNAISFLDDTSLGGRLPQLLAFLHAHWLPQLATPISPLPKEMLYAQWASKYGYLVMLFFAAIYSAPLLLCKPKNTLMRVCRYAMSTYLVVMAIDAGFVLVPVQFYYWCVMGIYFGLSEHEKRKVVDAHSL